MMPTTVKRPRDPVSRLADDGRLRGHLQDRLVGMRADRMSWWTHWRELADYILPRRYMWLVTPNRSQRGSPINQRIIDNTATVAARTLANGLMSGATSPARPWFKLGLEDTDLAKYGPVSMWLDEVTKRLLRIMARSNFYSKVATSRMDLSVFGTAPMYIEDDYRDVIRCWTPAAGEYYLANDEDGEVGTFYREFCYTMLQTARRFGLANCSPTVRTAIQTGGAMLGQEIVIAHAVEENDQYVPGAPGTKGMPFREVYWEVASGQDNVLRIRGFHEWPVPTARWYLVGNDAYGHSCGMDALGDVKQLQVEQKRKAQGIDKQVNPPLVAHVSLQNQPASVIPGGVTYASDISGVGMKPIYMVEPDLNGMIADIVDVRHRIQEAFFYDLFLMISQLDTVRTATEIDARREEKLVQLGPVLERDEKEFLGVAIERIFGIAHRKGLLPPPPAEVAGSPMRIDYISVLAQMQKAAATSGIERLMGFVGNLAAAKPDVLDKIDTDETVDVYSDLLGVPPRIVIATSKLTKIRAARNAQQQAQQQAQTSLAAAQGAATLSHADIGGGQNALQAAIGQMGASR